MKTACPEVKFRAHYAHDALTEDGSHLVRKWKSHLYWAGPGKTIAEIGELRFREIAQRDRPHRRRRLEPARRLRVEGPELLELAVALLVEHLDAHRRRQLEGTRPRLVLLARPERLAVVADAAPPLRALLRAVAEHELAALRVLGDDVGLAARSLHLGK